MEKQIIKNSQNPRAIIHPTARLVFTPAHSSFLCVRTFYRDVFLMDMGYFF